MVKDAGWELVTLRDIEDAARALDAWLLKYCDDNGVPYPQEQINLWGALKATSLTYEEFEEEERKAGRRG